MRATHKNGSIRPRSDSGDNDTLSQETVDPQNVTKDQFCLLGEGGIGMNIEFFTDVAYKNTEPRDKGDPDAKSKSRENEMEVKMKNVAIEDFKCDPCTKSKHRKDTTKLIVDIYVATLNGSKNDSALSIDKISDAQHAAIIEYRKDRGPKSMGPEPGRIVSKVDFKRRHLSKYLPRNSNSSQSKTARPKDTLVSTRHAAEFMGLPA